MRDETAAGTTSYKGDALSAVRMSFGRASAQDIILWAPNGSIQVRGQV